MAPAGFFVLGVVAVLPLFFRVEAATAATIYRCDTAAGVEYADIPCGNDARTVEINDNRLGGSLGEGLPEVAPQEHPAVNKMPSEAEEAGRPTTCRTFLSTELRTYLIREQVVAGMTRAHVREAWGPPVEAYAGPIEMWTYDNTYYGRLMTVTRVYFEDGCVTSVETVKP